MLPGQSNALSHCADNQTPQDVAQDKLSQAKSGRRELRTMMTEPLTVVGSSRQTTAYNGIHRKQAKSMPNARRQARACGQNHRLRTDPRP